MVTAGWLIALGATITTLVKHARFYVACKTYRSSCQYQRPHICKSCLRNKNTPK